MILRMNIERAKGRMNGNRQYMVDEDLVETVGKYIYLGHQMKLGKPN